MNRTPQQIGYSDSGSQGYAQWPLNPSAYQNASSDQVDWAALAQQWIIMKEAGPPVPEQMASATLSSLEEKHSKENLTEAGEAPMDVDNEKEEPAAPQWNEGNISSENSWSWNQQQQQWNWVNNWAPPSGVPPPGPPPLKPPLLPTPTPYNQYSSNTETVNENYGGYNTVPNEYAGGYWTASGAAKLKPHNKRYSKVNVPRPAPVAAPEPVTLDANKRKQLPAWIREGLEKMERDKQKLLERERERLEREQQVEKAPVDQKEALEIIRSTMKQKESKSKFESDDEASDKESEGQRTPEVPKVSQEDMMLKVRRTMTEILLKVTNKQILELCKEELQRHLRKTKASDQSVSASSGTNITNRLGLGVYEDMESSSENSSDEQQDKRSYDSDAELKNTIRKKKAEFLRTERLIEEKLSAAEKNKEDNMAGTPKDDNNDSQVDANNQGTKRKPSGTSDRSKRRISSRSSSTSSSSSSSSASNTESSEKTKRRPKSQRKIGKKSRSSYDGRSDRDGYSSSGSSRSRTPDTRLQHQISRESEKSKSDPAAVNSKRRRRKQSSKSPQEKRRKQSKSPVDRRRSSSTEKERQRKSVTVASHHRSRRYSNRRSRSRSREMRCSRSSSARSRSNSLYARRSRSRKRTKSRSRSKETKYYNKRDSGGSKYTSGRRSEERDKKTRKSRSRSRNRNDRSRRRSSSRHRSSVSRDRYHRSRTRSRSRGKRSERR